MRIVVLAAGSRGDVQPNMALGLGLQEAGHTIRFATHRPFESFVTGYGLEFAPLAGDPIAWFGTKHGRGLLSAGPDRIKFMNHLIGFYRQEQGHWETEIRDACAGAELIIHSNLAMASAAMAYEMGIPSFLSALQPIVPLFNWGPYRGLEQSGYPILYGFSPTLIPKAPDWGDSIWVTGFWFLDQPPGWAPPSDLLEFIDSGPAPISVGFGSMAEDEPEALTDMVLRAVEQADQRAVLLTGWGALGEVDLPSWAHLADALPYDWLFPRMAAVVHHGGPGTVAEGLRAGVPNVCVPYFGCQFLWGPRVAELGGAPPVVPRTQLSAERLSDAIKAALIDGSVRRRAAALGDQLRAEDGVVRAVEAIHRHLETPPALERARQAIHAMGNRFASSAGPLGQRVS
jgi:UDP:flavonoid glycosyltransferase YjiC (YdhE family)